MRTVILETRDGWRKEVTVEDGAHWARMPFMNVTGIEHARAEYHDMRRDVTTYCKVFECDDIEQLDENHGIEVWREK